jgi:hypothetical protein
MNCALDLKTTQATNLDKVIKKLIFLGYLLCAKDKTIAGDGYAYER